MKRKRIHNYLERCEPLKFHFFLLSLSLMLSIYIIFCINLEKESDTKLGVLCLINQGKSKEYRDSFPYLKSPSNKKVRKKTTFVKSHNL